MSSVSTRCARNTSAEASLVPSSTTTAFASCSTAARASSTPDEDDRPTSASSVSAQSARPASTSSRPPSKIESPMIHADRWILERAPALEPEPPLGAPLLPDVHERLRLNDGLDADRRARRRRGRRARRLRTPVSATDSVGAGRRSRPPSRRRCPRSGPGPGSVRTGTANRTTEEDGRPVRRRDPQDGHVGGSAPVQHHVVARDARAVHLEPHGGGPAHLDGVAGTLAGGRVDRGRVERRGLRQRSRRTRRRGRRGPAPAVRPSRGRSGAAAGGA